MKIYSNIEQILSAFKISFICNIQRLFIKNYLEKKTANMIVSFELNNSVIQKNIRKYQCFINKVIKNHENVCACCKFFILTKFVCHFNDIDF